MSFFIWPILDLVLNKRDNNRFYKLRSNMKLGIKSATLYTYG